MFTRRKIPRSSRVQRFDARQPSHRTVRCILLNNLRIIMIMPVMAILRGNSSDYTVVAMITDDLAFNRFTVISVAAVASGAVRTKVYNYGEATLRRSLLGVPFRKGLSLLQVVRRFAKKGRVPVIYRLDPRISRLRDSLSADRRLKRTMIALAASFRRHVRRKWLTLSASTMQQSMPCKYVSGNLIF